MMRRAGMAVVLAVGLGVAGGVVTAGLRAQNAAPAAMAGAYRIAGQVVNSTTGEPVRRATVAALAEADSHIVASVQTDGDGRFALDSLPAGKYPLTACKRGYRTSFFDEHDEYNSAIVTGEGQDTGNLVFKLTPNAVLHGVVTGDGGDAVEGASVLLFERTGAHGADERMNEVDATTTDDGGGYEFGGLAAGEYVLAVSASPWYAMHPKPDPQGGQGDASPLDVAYPVTYFDSTMDENAASPIVLAEGTRQEADIALHAVPALRLRVNVPRRTGSGIARPELRQIILGVQVSAESTGFLDALKLGSAEFSGLAPGQYQLTQGDPPRIASLDLTSSQDVDAASGSPAATVSGILRSSSGGALPEGVTVTLEPVGDRRGRAGVQAPAHRGEFHFDAVPAGTWSLGATTPSQALPVVAVSVSNRARDARSGGGSGSQITVKDQPVMVAGTVSLSLARVEGFARRDGKGVAGAMVVLIPKSPSAYRALVRRDQSDSDGSFALRDVPAGQYSVVAIEDGWKLDWTEREAMTRYLTTGVEVTVPERAGAVINVPKPVAVQAR